MIGIDQRQIIRTEPQSQIENFLASDLVAIEFDRPDFPWLFTPAKAHGNEGRLRPWLCLIVVRQQEGVSIGSRSGSPLPVLSFPSYDIAQQELPDLSESWAWAHSQVLHEEGLSENLYIVMDRQPNVTLSCLICPRRLKNNIRYYACLVPAFGVGRKTGLNLPFTNVEKDINTQILEPAWVHPEAHQDETQTNEDETEPFELPVYYHWEFKTGEGESFQQLAKKLTPQTYTNIGSRRLYVGQGGVPDWEDMGSVNLEGVFRPAPPANPITVGPPPWIEPLRSALQAPDSADPNADPVVGPPIYAHFHRGVQQLSDQSPKWLNDLNLDIRHRIAAGLGVFLVQKLQEELMHSAWQQLGDIQRAQQIKSQRELGKEVNHALYQKHFDTLPREGTLLYQMTAPVHSRVSMAN